jgi:prepilin-type N-terminal cleavage/methylation domain-containing protein
MRRIRGFTLIELLVVIGIIAILIAILIPVLRKVREHSYAVVCQSNMRQIITAFIIFAHDHRDHFPGCGYDGQDGHEDWFYGRSTLFADAPYKGSIYPYLKTPNIYFCPGVERVLSATGEIVPNDYATWPVIHGALRTELKEGWFGRRRRNQQGDWEWDDTDYPRARMAFPVLVQWDLHHKNAETSFLDQPVSKFQSDFMEHCHHGGSYIAAADGSLTFFIEPPIDDTHWYWWGVHKNGQFGILSANVAGWNRWNY